MNHYAEDIQHHPGERRAEACGVEAAARQRQAGGRAADSAAGGGAEARRQDLVMIANNSSGDNRGQQGSAPASDSRRERHQRRIAMDRSQRLLSETCEYLPAAKRLIRCGRTIRSKDGVKVKRGCDGNVFTSGLSTCGSVWSCPSCSFKIRVKRALEIALAIVVHLARGGGVLFMTFTMSHERGEELGDVWDILTDGWSYMTSGEQWQAIKERFGVVGWIKSTEVTHGRNGWHPHLHVLVFTERPLSPLDSSDDYWNLRIALRERWIHRFSSKWGRDVSHEFGLDTIPVKPDESSGIGQYVTKVGFELALADRKIGRSEGQRHPFAIARDAAETGDVADINLFREWITASKRRKCITWSKGLRADLLGTVEQSDEELAAEETPGEDLAEITPALWALIIVRRDGAKAQMLNGFEAGGLRRGVRVLEDLGLCVEVDTDRPVPLLRPGEPPTNHQAKEFQS